MPPKKSQPGKAARSEKEAKIPDRSKEGQPDIEENGEKVEDENAPAGQKRKSPPTLGAEPAKKEPKKGSRASSRTTGGSGKDATSKQLLNFLLSKDAIPLCYPEDELNAVKSGKFKKCYSLTPPSLFNPFEHLLTAHLLSKPLSHTLGMRSIRTLLNEPYSLNTPEKIKAEGEKRVWQGLEDARTQHRQKTAAYIFQMGQEYAGPEGSSGDSDIMLDLATQANEGGPNSTISHIKETVKGMGQTGGEIFCRRVQAVEGWGEALWPYADPRAIDALREIGVKVADAEELQTLIEREVDWEKVGDMGLIQEKKGHDEKDYEVQVAVEFVTVLERAIGCALEGKVGELRKAAVNWK